MGKIVAAIPAFNEAKTIGSVVLAAGRYVDKVVVVDDGSVDDTSWIAEQAGATVIQHEQNRGYGAATRTCLEYARSNGVQALVILDGDGQHRPDAIPRVVGPIEEGVADICIGSRMLESQSASHIPLYRRIGIRFLTRLTNVGTRRNGPLRDAQSGFRAYSRAAIEAIDPRDVDMGASVEILWEGDRQGLKIVEVPIDVDYDVEGSTHGPIRHGLGVIGSMIRYVETEHSLLVFGVPAALLLAIGLALGLNVMDRFSQTSELAIGLALLTVLVMVMGLLMGFTGLVLHAVINANRRLL